MPSFLMCPPEYFTVAYEINPFMHSEVAVDHDQAVDEWQGLVSTLEACGATIEVQPAVPDLPDLVFTANAGIVDGRVAVPSRFLHPQRRDEEEHDIAWFAARGFEVRALPGDAAFEGAGDAMAVGPDGVIVAGYRWRSSVGSHAALSSVLRRPVRSLELADPRFYHLDLALRPLGPRRALAVGAAFDSYATRVLAGSVPEVEELTLDEGLAFCANAVVVGEAVVMHTCPPRVGRVLEGWGYHPVEAPVGEFLKAGGSCRCLTLKIDDGGAPCPSSRAATTSAASGKAPATAPPSRTAVRPTPPT